MIKDQNDFEISIGDEVIFSLTCGKSFPKFLRRGRSEVKALSKTGGIKIQHPQDTDGKIRTIPARCMPCVRKVAKIYS